MNKNNKKKAFTLVELLVVVSIIALLIAILLPVIRDALFRGKLTALAANARSIHQAVFSKSTEDIYITSDSVWPISSGNAVGDEATFETSSEFFHTMVTAGHFNVGWNFFGGPSIAVASDGEEFRQGGYSAWSVVADLTDASIETVPFVFTRNLDVEQLTDSEVYTPDDDGRPQKLGGEENRTAPFQNKGFVFVTKGGSAFTLFKDQLKVGDESRPGQFRMLFNILDEDSEEIGNEVLKPDDGG